MTTRTLDLAFAPMCVCQALDVRAATNFPILYPLLGFDNGSIRTSAEESESFGITDLLNRELTDEEQTIFDATYDYANGLKCHLCQVGAPQPDQQVVGFFESMTESVPTEFLVDFFNDPYFNRETFEAQREVLMRYPLPDDDTLREVYARLDRYDPDFQDDFFHGSRPPRPIPTKAAEL